MADRLKQLRGASTKVVTPTAYGKLEWWRSRGTGVKETRAEIEAILESADDSGNGIMVIERDGLFTRPNYAATQIRMARLLSCNASSLFFEAKSPCYEQLSPVENEVFTAELRKLLQMTFGLRSADASPTLEPLDSTQVAGVEALEPLDAAILVEIALSADPLAVETAQSTGVAHPTVSSQFGDGGCVAEQQRAEHVAAMVAEDLRNLTLVSTYDEFYDVFTIWGWPNASSVPKYRMLLKPDEFNAFARQWNMYGRVSACTFSF